MKRENWISNIVVFLVVAIIYAFINAVKFISPYSSSGLRVFFYSAVWMSIFLLGLYLALSFTKLSKYVKIIVSGFFAPIVINVLNAIFNKVSLRGLYPIALVDSVIIVFLLAGGFFLADKVFGGKK